MKGTVVSIDRIVLRFRGIPSGLIRTILPRLGSDILQSLGNRKSLVKLNRSKFVGDLDGGRITVRGPIASKELGQTVANGLVDRIDAAGNASHGRT